MNAKVHEQEPERAHADSRQQSPGEHPPQSPTIRALDQYLDEVEREVEQAPYWKRFTSPQTPKEQVLKLMGEVMLEIWSYQHAVTDSVFTAVGRLGCDISEQPLIRSMIAVQIEEVGHGKMGLQDYVALGGDENFARTRRPSPQAQALMGIVRGLGEREDPLCHLGYMYFFEKFTTIMTEKAMPFLVRADYPNDRLQFMRLHAEEDIRHADMLSNVIIECERRYPTAHESILYGFQCFRVVYPHAVWQAAADRADCQKSDSPSNREIAASI